MNVDSHGTYDNGFAGGLTIRGVPVLNSYSRNVRWVDSAGSPTGRGSFKAPHLTVDDAINHSGVNDLILIKAGHTETLVAATAVTQDVAGLAIVGMGQGSKRPTFTFTPAAAGTNNWTITAAACSVENIIGKPGLDAITNPFNVSGASAYLDIEWQDASAAIEAETVILTTAAADQITINLTYRGFPAGNACVAPIKLNGATDARVNVDFYGLASTAVVNFVTTLSTNVLVTGYMFNSTDTTGAKLVVDTITNSLWYADIYAGAAGTRFKGGSAAAIAGDPAISAVTDALYGANGVASWPGEAAAANAVSIAEVLLYIQNGVRRGSGTSLGANKSVADALGTNGITLVDDAASVVGILGVDDSNNAFASTNVAADKDGSILERLEYIQSLATPQTPATFVPGLGYRVTKTEDVNAAATDDLFDVTGKVLVTVLTGEVTNIIGAQPVDYLLRIKTDNVALCASTDISAAGIGVLYNLTGQATDTLETNAEGVKTVDTGGKGLANRIVGLASGACTIQSVRTAGDASDAIVWTLFYLPLEASASVAASA